MQPLPRPIQAFEHGATMLPVGIVIQEFYRGPCRWLFGELLTSGLTSKVQRHVPALPEARIRLQGSERHAPEAFGEASLRKPWD